MADEQPQRPTIRLDPDHSVSVFVTDAIVTKPGETMFFLDLIQMDVSADPPGRATVVARTVFTRGVAESIVKQLSVVLPAFDAAAAPDA